MPRTWIVSPLGPPHPPVCPIKVRVNPPKILAPRDHWRHHRLGLLTRLPSP